MSRTPAFEAIDYQGAGQIVVVHLASRDLWPDNHYPASFRTLTEGQKLARLLNVAVRIVAMNPLTPDDACCFCGATISPITGFIRHTRDCAWQELARAL